MTTFQAQCVTIRDPFNPMKGRDIQLLDKPVTIREIAPETSQPFLIMRNSEYVLRADWDQEVKTGDSMAVVLLPQGGGDGGSDVTRVIMMIVVAVVAYYTGVYVGGQEGLAMGAGYGYAAQAAVGIVGSPSINNHMEAMQ